MRGPKPKPSHIKLVTGNPGRRPLNAKEPKPAGNLLHPPEWFTDSQKTIWTQAIASAPAGLLKQADEAALSAFVVARDLFRHASERLNPNQMLVKTPNGMAVQSPFLAIVNRQSVLMLRAAAELGFTPSSRTRVETSDDEQADDEFFGKY